MTVAELITQLAMLNKPDMQVTLEVDDWYYNGPIESVRVHEYNSGPVVILETK